MGIGPTTQAWEAYVLPLYYTRKYSKIIAIFFSFGNVKSCDIISHMQEIIAKLEELRQRIASVSDCL
jgi:hypothetical protein